MSKEAMKLALEALELMYACYAHPEWISHKQQEEKILAQCAATTMTLRQTLAKQEGQSNFCPQCEALASELKAIKQEQGEPVAVVDSTISGHIDWLCTIFPKQGTKLYTTPQQRPSRSDMTWVGLTDEEMEKAMEYWSDKSRSAYGGAYSADEEYVSMVSTWRYIEAKLKEKNGYAEEKNT